MSTMKIYMTKEFSHDNDQDVDDHTDRDLEVTISNDQLVVYIQNPKDPEDDYGEIILDLEKDGTFLLRANDHYGSSIQIRFREPE